MRIFSWDSTALASASLPVSTVRQPTLSPLCECVGRGGEGRGGEGRGGEE